MAAQSEVFKEENAPAERLHGLDQQMERKEDESLYFMDRTWVLLVEWVGGTIIRTKLIKTSSVHDTFHVSNLKKCLVDANLNVPLEEIKIDKTLRFVEEPIEIMDREVKSLKRSKIPIVKVCWNSKCGPEFTWECEDHMKAKYPRLFAECAVEPTSEIIGMKFLKAEVVMSTFDVLQRFGFFLQMGFTLILATLDGLDVGLLGDVIGEDDCDDDG
ncbi:hypothetical protein Tco_0089508 [Tanacetum coccineum]